MGHGDGPRRGHADPRRSILEQIAAELASGPLDEKLERLAGGVKGDLDKLGQAK